MMHNLKLPPGVESLRPQQVEFLELAPVVFEEGRKVLLVEMPVGSGKSLCGALLGRLLKHDTAYLTITKHLQDQLAGDYPEVGILKGLTNYPTENFPERFPELTCEDCDGKGDEKPCSWCRGPESCPYKQAKQHAKAHELAILNFALWLSIQNLGDAAFGTQCDRDLIVMDEGDQLENALMSFISLEIPHYRLEQWGMNPPTEDPATWIVWLKAVANRLHDGIKGLDQSDYLASLKQGRRMKQLIMKIMSAMPAIERGGWVLTSKGEEGRPVKFQPLMVDQYAQPFCWRHGKQFVVMSGTMGDPEVFAQSLGLSNKDYWFLEWGSVFPVENRPIYLWPAASLNRANEELEFPEVMRRIHYILTHHNLNLGQRCLIHSVSQKRAERIYRYLYPTFGDRLIKYDRASEREDAIARYCATPGSIIIGQSLGRGVDFPDDLCRCNIITKVPYPDLSSPQVKGRKALPGGDKWYGSETVRDLVQMSGRGNRHIGDQCSNYILDGAALNTIQYNHVPKYFREALVYGAPPWDQMKKIDWDSLTA